ncbi:hypothetical protein M758_2G028900 [Ceratodon purpureus]|uniref:Uncharacterized protein n=1 Tax=Ceratodon purpureus TaxID=3225 RepID=A0A8T0ISC4_CERPU|nr:hypothetical protein KC19_2G029700 [Ceratodon purpureus]KAG0625115.1 hypothetical protein M758_2G028900 [Ceratodon purpureus]
MVGAEVRWWSANTVAVVTGSNKGVGYEIARQLARNGLTTVVTARDVSRGTKAVEALRTEVGSDRIAFHPLDVCSEESAVSLSMWLKQTYGGADILINNAGVLFNENETVETDITTLQTNYYGVKNVTKAVLPVLRSSPAGARVIMVSSALGQLHSLRNHYRKELANRDRITEAMVDEFVESFLEEKKTGKGPGGWPRGGWSPSYCVSKMAVNAYMSIVAREVSNRPEGQRVYVNSFTPGYTSTNMTSNRGHPVEDGAMTGVWLALHPPRGHPVGKFWADKCHGEMSF